ncbi:hypothetical protein PG993_014441 [Apiospora rasikravindrae]|uniref:F-box domain-containing protein n=1 Tax=Apiospora rasikravindrae TaxID=990691 RepID=A0ABR1RN75_9PEZI
MSVFSLDASLVAATCVGLSNLPVELLAHILGDLDSYEDLAASLSSSPILLNGFLYKKNTILSTVVCSSIGVECLPDALAIVRCPNLSGITDGDELHSRISGYLTNRASQDPRPSSREESVLLCQLDRIIMRFVDDYVRKAKLNNLASLPHWADSSFSRRMTVVEGMPRIDISRAELTRYKLAFLRHELFQKVFIRNQIPRLFSTQEQSGLLMSGLEMWEIVGIEVVNGHFRRQHQLMRESLYDEMQRMLCQYSQQHAQTQPEQVFHEGNCKAPEMRVKLNEQADVVELSEVALDLFPRLTWTSGLELSESLTADDIAIIYKRICTGHDGLRNELRAKPCLVYYGCVTRACYVRSKQLLQAGQDATRMSSRAFPGPTESWKAGLRPIHLMRTYQELGQEPKDFLIIVSTQFAAQGWAFLDRRIDIEQTNQETGARRLRVELRGKHWGWEWKDTSREFLETFNGLYITRNNLASFQQKYGVTNKTK